MFYAAKNIYSTPNSIGFCNTWVVVGFPTIAARDAYVLNCPNLATKAIKASEIRQHGGEPGRVNYYDFEGEYHIHMGHGEFA
jgi:hypothetical protein